MLPPSRFGAGYSVGTPESAPGSSPSATADPSGHGYGQSARTPQSFATAPAAYGGTAYAIDQPAMPRRTNGVVIGAAVVATLLLGGGGFLAGHWTSSSTAAGRNQVETDGADAALPGRGPFPTAASVSESGITVSESDSDAVPHPTEGRVYGPSDIQTLSVRSDGTNLVITTVYSPSTPMNSISGATRIRLDPDAVPRCKDSVLASFDWSVEYDTDGVSVVKPGASCDDGHRPTAIGGSADISGNTLTIRVNQESLGLQSGQQIAVRACISTRIDDSYTTFIQDWAPDSPSGITGGV